MSVIEKSSLSRKDGTATRQSQQVDASKRRRNVLRQSLKKPDPPWTRIPEPPYRYDRGFKTYASDAYLFVNRAVEHTVPAYTALNFETTLEKIEASSLQGKHETIQKMRRSILDNWLAGRNFHFHLLHIDEAEHGAQNIQQELNDHRLPLWITGEIEPKELLSLQQFADHILARTPHGMLQGKVAAEAAVFDGNLSVKKSNPRPTSVKEFIRVMIEGCVPPDYLNFLDILNDTDTRMTPVAITEISLEAILRKREDSSFVPAEFLIASTAGAVSPMHQDSMGQGAWLRPIEGNKAWHIPTCSAEEAEEAHKSTLKNYRFPPGLEFCAINISEEDKGACWIQPPGQKHWVYTGANSFFVGGFFYTAELFHKSIRAIREQLCENSESNEDPTPEIFDLLRQIVDLLLDDKTVFSELQRDYAGYELYRLVQRWTEVQVSFGQGWYVDKCREACDAFISTTKKWSDSWMTSYDRECKRVKRSSNLQR